MLIKHHSLAAQGALSWILNMQSRLGTSYTDTDLKDYIWKHLNAGQVIPGFGHAVLRQPDPRFKALMDFASSRPEIKKDALFQLVERNSKIAPVVLQEHGKVRRGISIHS
jgi:citrate synthase